MVFGVSYAIHELEEGISLEKYGLSKEAFNDLKCKIEEGANASMRGMVRDTFYQVFLDMYHYDHKLLKTELSKQVLLKSKVVLSDEETKRLLCYLRGYLSEHGESALVHEILKHLSTLD